MSRLAIRFTFHKHHIKAVTGVLLGLQNCEYWLGVSFIVVNDWFSFSGDVSSRPPNRGLLLGRGDIVTGTSRFINSQFRGSIR